MSGSGTDSVATKLLLRRGLSSNVPTLDVGELAYDTDTGALRVGNGTSTPPRVFTEGSSGTFNCQSVILVTSRLGAANLAPSSAVYTDANGYLTTAPASPLPTPVPTPAPSPSPTPVPIPVSQPGLLTLQQFNNGFNATSHTYWRGDLTWASINLATDVTGVLPIANGGTGANTDIGARASLGVPGLNDINTFTQNNTIGGGLVVGNPTGGFLGAGSVNVSNGFYVNGKPVQDAPICNIEHTPDTDVFQGNPLFSCWFPCQYTTPVEVELHCEFKQDQQSPSTNICGISGFQIVRGGTPVSTPDCALNVATGGDSALSFVHKFLDTPPLGWNFYQVNAVGVTAPASIGNRTFKLTHNPPFPQSIGPAPQ